MVKYIVTFIIIFSISCKELNKDSYVTKKYQISESEIEELRELKYEIDRRLASKSNFQGSDKNASIKYFNPKFSKSSTDQLYDEINLRQRKIKKEVYSEDYYGNDDRYDLFEIKNQKIRDNALATFCFIDKNRVKKIDGNNYKLILNPTGYCKSEKFYDQGTIAFCTGFAVSPTMLITAGHCINKSDYKNCYIVSGFSIDFDRQKVKDTINNIDIYEVQEVIPNTTMLDYTYLVLNKPISPKNRIATLRNFGKISNTDSLYVIGFPNGLPLKIADNGIIRENRIQSTFLTNLDTYHGNSGSPVFNSRTHEVEGILVEGKKDFLPTPENCIKSYVCGNLLCSGETVIRITELKPKLNEIKR